VLDTATGRPALRSRTAELPGLPIATEEPAPALAPGSSVTLVPRSVLVLRRVEDE